MKRVYAASCVLQGNTITVSCDFTPGTYYYNGTFTVNAGVTVTAGNATTPGLVTIIADDFVIDGAINANALGSAGAAGTCPGGTNNNGGGACHGGDGGISAGTGTIGSGGIAAYGSATGPVTIGSGGGDDNNTVGIQSGAGGGAVKIATWSATGTLAFGAAGSVTANGANASSIEAGGGSGGSVWIDVGDLDIAEGSITANGGNASGSGTNGGGGGGGGRVAIVYSTTSGSLAQTRQAFGGNRGTTTVRTAQPGGAGTLFVWDRDVTNGAMTIDDNAQFDPPFTRQVAGDSYTFASLAIRNGAQYVVSTTTTLTVESGGSLTAGGSAGRQSKLWVLGTFNAPSEAMTISGLDIHQNGTIGVLKYLTFDNGLYGIEPSSALFSAGPGNRLGSLVLSGTGTTTYSATGTGTLFVDLFQAKSNVTVTHATNTTSHLHSLAISATSTITIDSGATVSLTDRGFTGGACNVNGSGTGGGAKQSGGSHGGDGGQGGATTSTTSTAYGSITSPTTLGSGGGGFASCAGGSGGYGAGVVTLSASGTVTINGTISAAGTAGSGTAGGGGAGGSVWIEAPTIAGTGTINARGGNGSGSTGTNAAGGGGGGHIAVSYANGNPSNWTTTAYGGAASGSSGYAGGAGTIFLDDTDDAQPNGTLILDNNNQSGADSGQSTSTSVQFDSVTIRNGGKYGVRSGRTLKLPSGGAVTGGGSTRPAIKVYNGGELDANTASWDVEGIDIDNSGTLRGPTSLSFKGSCFALRGAGRFHAAANVLQFRASSCFELESTDPNMDLTSLDIPAGSTFTRTAGTTAPFGPNFQTLNIYGTYMDSSMLPLFVDVFTVQSGGLVTHATNTNPAVQGNQLIISATTSITVFAGGNINTSGRGYQGGCSNTGVGPGASSTGGGGSGASHGGNGGSGNGSTYGSVTAPSTIGSAGSGVNGFCSNGFGGNGGGAIKLIAGGTVLIAGTVNAAGTAGTNFAGGGTGGSIWIDAGTLTGGGTITAAGGGASSGGGGGGGRMALYYNTDSGTGTRSTASANGAIGGGGAGTIFLDDKDDALPNGTLVVDNNNLSGAATTQMSGAQTYDSVDVREASNYVIPNGSTLTIGSGGTLVGGGSTRGTVTVNSGGILNTGASNFTFNEVNVTNSGSIQSVTNLTVEGSSTTLSGAGTFSATLTGLTLRSSTFTQGSSNAGMNVTSLVMNASTYNNNTTRPGLNLANMNLGSNNTFNNNSTAYYPLGSGFADLTVFGNFTQNATTTLFVDDLVVQSGGLIMHATNTSTTVPDKAMDISATSSISVLSGGSISVAGRGFAGGCGAGNGPGAGAINDFGSGYGGNGGNNSGGSGGATYGSVTAPWHVGSGGSSVNGICSNGLGGAGGGSVKLRTAGTMLVAGTLTASAAAAPGGYGAGGSGGSVWLDVGTLTGGSAITADGGAVGGSGVTGGGGGGRIALYYNTDSATGTRTAYGSAGVSGGQRGGAGTIFIDDKDDALPNGSLVVNNNNQSGAATTQVVTASQTYDALTIQGGASYTIPSGNTLAVSSSGTFTGGGSTKPTVTVSSGGTFDLNKANLDLQNVNVTNAGSMPDITTLHYGGGTFTHSGTFNAGLTSLTVGAGGNFTHATTAQLFTGSDLTIESGGTFTQSSSSTLNITTVLVKTGGTLTHCDNSTTHACSVNISATTFTVQPGGLVGTDALGFDSTTGNGQGGDGTAGGGAGHGGVGGIGRVTSVNQGTGGPTYSATTTPNIIGSGGGDDTNNGGQQGGSGGGAIILTVSGTFTMNGDLSADGQNGTANEGGGGSGGSIWLTLSTWTGSGTGTITAVGGTGNGTDTTGGGCGAGGRIYATYGSKTYTGTAPSVAAGSGCTGFRAGQAGSFAEVETSPTITAIAHSPSFPTTVTNVTISATATYSSGLDKIELYLDGTTGPFLRHTCDFAAPTSGFCSIPVGLLTSGTHTTTVKAYGNDTSVTTGSEEFLVSGNSTSNSTALSRLKVGVLATFTLSYTLSGTSTQDLIVTFPAGFTVQSAFTSGSACLSNFGFTSNTLTADTTNCTGTVSASGATVTNPSSPGAYTISWVDDEGEVIVAIVDDDQVSVSAAVDASITFNVGAQTAACDGTFSGNGGTAAFGTLTTSTVSTSDLGGVAHICSRVSSNAPLGTMVTVRSQTGSLRSISTPAHEIPSGTATLTAGSEGYGLCAGSGGGDTGADVGAAPTRVAPFNGSCSTGSHAVGGLTTSPQVVWNISGPAQNAFARLFLKAAISSGTPAHNDYTDVLTFIATGTY